MKKTLNIFVFITAVFFCLNAWAVEKLKAPTVEYSADLIDSQFTNADTFKVYYGSGGKYRIEQYDKDNSLFSTNIARNDKQVSWMIPINGQVYMETPLTGPNAGKVFIASIGGRWDVGECETNSSPLESEVVNGITAIKTKVSMSCPDDITFKGTLWITKDNIIVKQDVDFTKGESGSPIKMKSELKNLKIASQKPSLFEIPSGYNKVESYGQMGPPQASSTKKTTQTPSVNNASKDDSSADKTAVESVSQKSDKTEPGDSESSEAAAVSEEDSSEDPGDTEGVNPIQKADEAMEDTNSVLDKVDKGTSLWDRVKSKVKIKK